MKITKARLKQLIKEELNEISSDDFRAMQAHNVRGAQRPADHYELDRIVDETAEKIVMDVRNLAEIIGDKEEAVRALTMAMQELLK